MYERFFDVEEVGLGIYNSPPTKPRAQNASSFTSKIRRYLQGAVSRYRQKQLHRTNMHAYSKRTQKIGSKTGVVLLWGLAPLASNNFVLLKNML